MADFEFDTNVDLEDVDVDGPEVNGPVHPISGLFLVFDMIDCSLSDVDKNKAISAWDDAAQSTKNVIAKALAQTVTMLPLPSASLKITDDLNTFLACKVTIRETVTRCPAPPALEKMGCQKVNGGNLIFAAGTATCGPDGTVLTVSGHCGTLAASGLPADDLVGEHGSLSVPSLDFLLNLSFTQPKKSVNPLLTSLRAHGVAVAKALDVTADTYTVADLTDLDVGHLSTVAVTNSRKAVFAALKATLMKSPADALHDLASLPSLPHPPMEPMGPEAHFVHRLCSLVPGPVVVLAEASRAKNFRSGLPELQTHCVPVKLDAGNLPDSVIQEHTTPGVRLVNLHIPKGDQKAHLLTCEKFLSVANVYACKFKADQKLINLLNTQQQIFDIALVRGPSDRLEEVGVIFTRLTSTPTTFSLNDWSAVVSKFLHQDAVHSVARRLQLAALFLNSDQAEKLTIKELIAARPDQLPIKKKTTFAPADKSRLQALPKPGVYALGYGGAAINADDLEIFLVEPFPDDEAVQNSEELESAMVMEVTENDSAEEGKVEPEQTTKKEEPAVETQPQAGSSRGLTHHRSPTFKRVVGSVPSHSPRPEIGRASPQPVAAGRGRGRKA